MFSMYSAQFVTYACSMHMSQRLQYDLLSRDFACVRLLPETAFI